MLVFPNAEILVFPPELEIYGNTYPPTIRNAAQTSNPGGLMSEMLSDVVVGEDVVPSAIVIDPVLNRIAS